MVAIKILGPGCANCKKLEAVARAAATALGLEAEISKVSDYADIMSYSVLSTPALVVNGKVVCAGKIPTVVKVYGWLAEAAGS